MDDALFYGCIVALFLIMTGHPILAFFLFLAVI